MNAIFAPPPALPDSLKPFRFWIWLQFVALRIYVLAVTGKKARFLTVIDHVGNVHLVAIGDAPGETPRADPFAFELSAAYRAALYDHAASANQNSHPLRRQGCAAAGTRVACLRSCLRRGTRPEALPLPDT